MHTVISIKPESDIAIIYLHDYVSLRKFYIFTLLFLFIFYSILAHEEKKGHFLKKEFVGKFNLI